MNVHSYALFAATFAQLPSVVLWVAGIAAFVGFLLGSVPPRGDNRGWQFDMPGAVVWAIASALIAGGLAEGFSSGFWFGPAVAIAFGAMLSGMRLLATRPPRRPTEFELQAGVNRAPGETVRAKTKAARRMFRNASFRNGNYYATRGLREFRYSGGMTAEDVAFLAQATPNAYYDTFDILVLLVSRLPDGTAEPGVIVVRGAANLRRIAYGQNHIEIEGVGIVKGETVQEMVGYAWRR